MDCQSFTCCLSWTLGSSKCSLSYRYCFGRCSSELGQLVPLSYSQRRSAWYSDRLHNFSITIPRCYKDVYVKSFFPCMGRLWNLLPVECSSLTYGLSGFEFRTNTWLLTVDSFWTDFFYALIFLFIFYVIPGLVLAVQPCMKRIPIKKRDISELLMFALSVNVKSFISYRFFKTLFTSLIFIWNLEIFLCKVLKAITPFTLASSHFLPTVMIESAVLVGNFLFTVTSLFSTFIRIAFNFFYLVLVVHNLCLYWLLLNMPLLIAPSGVSQGEKNSASTMKWEIKCSWGSGCIVVQTMMI